MTEYNDAEMKAVNESVMEYLAHFNEQKSIAADQPISVIGTLRPWDEAQRGKITAEVQLAHAYYMDPRNNEGSLGERRKKLDRVIYDTFARFVKERTAEYRSVLSKYKGVDWIHNGTCTKTLSCQPGFEFIPESVDHTRNGDWKAGPIWGPNYTTLTWKTGGHGRAETFVTVDARYANVDKVVLAELNSAQAVLHDRGIPSEWPMPRPMDDM